MEVPFNTSPEPQDPKPIAVPAPAVPPPAPIIAAKPPEVDMPSMPQADMSAVQLWVNQFQKSADAQRAEQVKSFRAAVAENPDQAAKKVAVAKELGLDPTDPSQDWKIAEQFSKQREIERQAFDWKYPELAAKMREWDFAAQAYDDLGNLQNIEGLWQWIKANWNQGQMMVERGQIGTRIAMGWSSQEDLERLEEINNAKKLPERTGLAYGIFGGTSEVLGQMSETLPASLAAAGAAVGVSAAAPPAGIITGPTAFLLTQGIQTAQIEGGNAYLDYLEAGLGEDEAKTSAFFVGVFNGAVETALGKFALKPFTSLGNKIGGKVMPKVFQPVTAQSGLADMAKAYALGVAGEVTTETVQEISQIAGQELATMYSREELDLLISTQDGRQQIYDRLGNIIAKTTMSMAVLGLPGPMANFMVDMQRAEAAKADTQIIKAISQGVKDARLAERNPQLAKEFVETAQGEAVTEVFINSETLRSRLTAIDQKATEEGKLQKSAFDVLREKLPEVSKQLDLAVGSNDTIRIKTSEMATQLAKSDVLSILMDDVRIDPNGMSMNEAIEYQPHIQKMAGQMKAQISEKAQQDKAFRESANRLRSQFVSQIVAAGRPLEQARIAANLQTMFVMRMVTTENAANGSSMLPEEWHAMHGMTTGAAETAAPIARPPLWLPKVVQEREQAATAQPEQITPEAVAEVAPSEPVAPPAQELTPYEQALDILTDPNAQITPEQRAELEQYVQQAESQPLRSITPDEDATYLAAVEAGDMETAQRMVDEAAKAAGLDVVRVYHGTKKEFTSFDPSVRDPSKLSYFSYDKEFARSYATGIGGHRTPEPAIVERIQSVKNLSKQFFEEQYSALIAKYGSREQTPDEEASALLDKARDYERSLLDGMTVSDAESEMGVRVLELYLDTGRVFNPRKQWSEFVPEILKYLQASSWESLRPDMQQHVKNGNYMIWEAPNVVNAVLEKYDSILLQESTISQKLDTIAVRDSRRIKSADPVTRDSQGNIIPLSQRFDTTKDSILYSQQPDTGVGGTYERLTRRTLLNSNATPATWFHELMHYMFDTYADMIRRGVATEAMQKDFQSLLEFAKFEGDFAAYSSANRDQQRVVHETVAYGWEQWLYEGKQMPFQLRKLMTTITQFFRSAWEGLKQINDTFFVETGQNLPGLTDEVRQVFSRMVAGEDQAKLAEATRAAVPLFLSREQWVAFGNPAEDWDSYMNEERNRLDEAAAQLTRMGIDALAIFSGTKDDRLKKLQKQYKEVRETMREEANSEVGLRKVYRLRQFLKNGTMVDAEGIEKTEKQQVFKMDRKMLLDIPAAFDVLRETAAKAVIAAESKLKALVSNEPRRLLVLPEKPRNVDPLAPKGVFDPKAVKAWELEVQRIKALNADNVAANAERLVLIKKARKELAKAKQVQRRVTQRLKTRENAIQERSPLDDYIKEGGLDPNIVRELFGYASVEEMVKELLNAPEFDEAVNKLIDLRMLREYGDLTSAEAMEEAVNMSLVNEHNTRWLTMELRTLERKMRGGANTPSDIEQQKQAAQQLAQMQTELEQLRAKRAAAKEAQDTAAVAAAETEIAGLKEQMKDVRQAADGALSMRIMRAAAREAARQVLSQRGIASIKPGLSQAAERRSSRDALTKLTNNDLPGAIQAKREQLLHNQMAAEAAEIQRYYKRTLKWFNSFFRKKDKSVAKGRSLEHVYAIRAILLAFGLGGTASQRSKRIADANMWLERLQKYEPTRYAEIKSLVEQAAKENKAVGTLTLEEFRRLESNVRTLWAEAEREKSIEIDGQKVLVEDAVASITDRASKLARTGALPGENKAITKKETAIGALHALRSSMRRAESLFDSWDGSEPGVFTKYFWRPLHKAIGTYRMSRDKYYKRYVQILKDLQPHLTSGPIAAQKYIKYDWTDMQELVAALTHTGNLSNKAKLLLGGRPNNPWATLNEDTGTVDSSRWEQMIADYVAAGILKQEHFDAVQAIWDLMEEMKPDIQRVYRTRFGTFFNEVPAEAFTITFADGTTKTYRGGYVPAKVDRDLVYNVFDPASVEEVNQEFRDSMPTTGWGFTITRMAGYNKPLDLDLSRVTQHIESVQRFVHIQPALWNVTRLLRDERVLQAFNSIDPTVLPNTIQPWLEKVASQRTGKSSSIPLLDKAVRWLRNNAGMAIMFGNISNTMQQLTGILLGAVKVKGSYLRGSLKRIVFASQETRRRIYGEISEKSQYMDQRFRTQIFDLQEQMNEVLINPSKFQKIQSWAKRHAYFMQQYVQNIVDAAVWNGAYEQAIADGQTEQEAVYRADAAVSLTQGGVQPEQISAIEGGQEWARLMTQFTGYFNMMANLNGTQFKKIVREVGWNNGKKELFHAWMLGFAAPTIAAGIIAKTFAGKWDDEDDDGYADETGLWLLDVLGRGALSMLPLGSSVMAVTINRMDDQTYNDRMMSAPAISMLERMGESLLGPSGFVRAVLSSEKDITGRKVRDVFSILDMVAGIPVSGIASKLTYAIESMTGTQENYNWADAIRGSITGISSEGTRQK